MLVVDLIEVLKQLAYRKRLIISGLGLGIVAGVILCLILPVMYTGTTKIMPPQQTESEASLMMNQLTSGGGSGLAALAALITGDKSWVPSG